MLAIKSKTSCGAMSSCSRRAHLALAACERCCFIMASADESCATEARMQWRRQSPSCVVGLQAYAVVAAVRLLDDEPIEPSAARLGSVRLPGPQSCDFTAYMCTGIILSNYKSFVNPLFKLISIEHVIIGSRTQWKTM